jgi:hypothetical protein
MWIQEYLFFCLTFLCPLPRLNFSVSHFSVRSASVMNHHVRQNGGSTTMLRLAPSVFQTPSLLAAIARNV